MDLHSDFGLALYGWCKRFAVEQAKTGCPFLKALRLADGAARFFEITRTWSEEEKSTLLIEFQNCLRLADAHPLVRRYHDLSIRGASPPVETHSRRSPMCRAIRKGLEAVFGPRSEIENYPHEMRFIRQFEWGSLRTSCDVCRRGRLLRLDYQLYYPNNMIFWRISPVGLLIFGETVWNDLEASEVPDVMEGLFEVDSTIGDAIRSSLATVT
ncbi:MAG: hypothetical protein SF187_21115 [Deltaproteobacteria bacterium]|nr:hypothetical protein [Deltaproteobacteria bacterium]